ncbi:phytanoyl-CoA dioxygenase family protein [Brevundimonas sp. FT23042]|uniref:phytanoyl-CoA dioxygenase family protein n=1 Tax=Brevundimonas sp. FT23042 TaxID=3393749 RepID=UPI003B5881F7
MEVLPVARNTLPSLFTRAFHRLQERLRHPARRRQLARIFTLPRHTARPLTEADQDLRRDGVTFMPGYFTKEQAAELKDLLSGLECQDPWKMDRGLFRLEDAPEGTHVADIPAAPTLQALHDIAFDPRLLALAARYFGGRPYVDSVQAWWSVSGNAEPEEAENFHRDNDSIRFLKFFLYLTDVDDENGPHRFVRGSHVEPKALERRRYTDVEIEDAFGTERILLIKGRSGDAFMEDTFGVHKGQLPRSGVRLLVQVRYSAMPTVFRSRLIIDGPRPALEEGANSLLHAN